MTSKLKTDHFARIKPIVGTRLQGLRVGVVGLLEAELLVKYLAACGIRRWLWVVTESGDEVALHSYLVAQHGAALDLDLAVVLVEDLAEDWGEAQLDLMLVVGSPADSLVRLTQAETGTCPLLLIIPPTEGLPGQLICHFPEDEALKTVQDVLKALSLNNKLTPLTPWTWVTMAPMVASWARAVLLQETPYARPDFAELWASGVRVATFEGAVNPLSPNYHTLTTAQEMTKDSLLVQDASFYSPLTRQGRLLIAGLGSLGSVAALALAPYVEGLVVADPDVVDVYNPVRQCYPLASIGQPKATVLAEQLRGLGVGTVVPLVTALQNEVQVTDLITSYDLCGGLILTGTNADFALARVLRSQGLSHVVGRCYPRARYWEGMVIDGANGPAFEDLRGHIIPGPVASLTPEQVAAYSDAGALEAEPATLIESGWAAVWLARLMYQLLMPPGLRERWFLTLLADEQTCLLGGAYAEKTADGFAYEINVPGLIKRWGIQNIG